MGKRGDGSIERAFEVGNRLHDALECFLDRINFERYASSRLIELIDIIDVQLIENTLNLIQARLNLS